MKVKKLLHTRYRVHDLERTVHFYREVLGLHAENNRAAAGLAAEEEVLAELSDGALAPDPAPSA